MTILWIPYKNPTYFFVQRIYIYPSLSLSLSLCKECFQIFLDKLVRISGERIFVYELLLKGENEKFFVELVKLKYRNLQFFNTYGPKYFISIYVKVGVKFLLLIFPYRE